VGVELAPQPLLYSLAVVSATAFVFSRPRHEAWRLLYRSRWLMLVLLLTYSYTLPGQPLWPDLGWLSPIAEGAQQGAVRILRLALMLLGLAVLLVSTERSRLIYGLYFIARPLTSLGFDRRAFAVRLGLTLEYVEHAPKATKWLDALRRLEPAANTHNTYSLIPERWQWPDSAVILACLVMLFFAIS
jgi:energy-coupling factor transporter transmembrane protein EcfT